LASFASASNPAVRAQVSRRTSRSTPAVSLGLEALFV
jgi:hypothetical protein